MSLKLAFRFVIKVLDRGLLKRTIQALCLAVGLGMSPLGEALFNTPRITQLPKRMATCFQMTGQITKLNIIISQKLIHLVRNLGQVSTKKIYSVAYGCNSKSAIFLI